MEGAMQGRTGRTFAFARIEKCPSATENLHNFLLSTAPLASGREPKRKEKGDVKREGEGQEKEGSWPRQLFDITLGEGKFGPS